MIKITSKVQPLVDWKVIAEALGAERVTHLSQIESPSIRASIRAKMKEIEAQGGTLSIIIDVPSIIIDVPEEKEI